jgi:NADH pyrophosphatase NudC (nudix superfamily)
MLDLPGGFVEPMESGENAVIREIEEELGVRVTKAEFMVSFPNEYVFSGFSVFTLDMAFICEVDNISGIVPADDVSDIEFIVPLEINKGELCSESMVKIIDYYINHKK